MALPRCEQCETEINPSAEFCVQCGARQQSQDATPDKPAYCSQCGEPLSQDAAFCSQCGQGVQDVAGADTPQASQPKPAFQAAGQGQDQAKGFSWGWYFKSMGMIILCNIASALIMVGLLLVMDQANAGLVLVLGLVFGALAFFVGGYWAAVRSPGRTIKEPALAAATLAVLSGLVQGEGAISLAGAIIPFVLGMLGAKLGERKQAAREARS